jgi:hypothetical protein
MAGDAAAQRAWGGANPKAMYVHLVDGSRIPGALVGIETVRAGRIAA